MLMTGPARPNGPHYPPITELVQNVAEFASPTDVYVRIFELMRTATPSVNDFGRVIIVNSSLFGFTNRIDTISRAITVIGTQEL